MKFQSYLKILLIGTSLLLASCGTSKPAKDLPQTERSAEQIYNEALTAANNKEYQKARALFEEVERQHPYSDLATQGQLKSAQISYEALRYDDTIAALDRFIDLHPGHAQIDYAYYLKALCYYEQISDIARDQAMTQQAMDALDIVVKRFPTSQYAREVTMKMDLTRDHLAGKEVEIGRYYLKRNEVPAALNRFKIVIDQYQTTAHVPEALHRMVESYMILGLKDEATRVAAVLAYNYPGSSWYRDSYALLDPAQRARLKDNRSWVSKTVSSLLKPE
jgi:outer membrane protein assembly factor BamD